MGESVGARTVKEVDLRVTLRRLRVEVPIVWEVDL